MRAAMVGKYEQSNTEPEGRGERVACWVERYMQAQGLSIGEVAFRIRADKRDVRRLLADRSCGHRLEDKLAAYFGWTFVRTVMAPVIETAIEAEIDRERSEIAAREARLAKLYAARAEAPPASGLVPPQVGAGPASLRLVAGDLGSPVAPDRGAS